MSVTRYEQPDMDTLPGQDVPKNVSPMIELGATGLRRTAGYIDEEFLPQLKGRKAIQVYREMADNDPTIGALLFAVDRLLRQVTWRVEPASQKSEDKQAAEFVEQCMEDMSTTWDDLITEVLTMLPYGWSWHEIVYKRRMGPWEKDPKKRSRFTDGRIGWRKIPIRAQETFQRWVFDETGGVKAFVQIPPPHYQQVIIPIEKSLLFRVSTAKGNPEGRSFLRNAYRPWYMKKRMEEIEAIGAERDLAGLPMARVPSDYLSAPKGSDKEKMVSAFKTMVRSVRRNEQEGIIIPRMVDPDTKQDMFDFSLLNSGGGRQFNVNEIIRRYEERILMTVLADFILVGHQSVGSYALHTDKTGLFRASMNSISESIADVFNRYAIPRLFEVNGWKVNELPRLVPGDIDPPDLTQLSAFMGQLNAAGVQWFPDPELEKFLRDAARLPKLDETSEQVKETEARQAAIMRLAQQRMEMVNLSNQSMQGEMGLEQQRMGLEQQAMQGETEANPEVQAAQDEQTVMAGDLDVEAKAQQLRHSEEKHQVELQRMTSDEKAPEREQKLKQSDELHREKIKQMRLKPKPPQAKEKK